MVIADNKTLFKCPGPSQWKFRAKSECKDTDKYICLFDGNGQKDEEFCGSWPDFENAGSYIFLSCPSVAMYNK